MIKISNLYKSYLKKEIFNDFSLELNKGEQVLIIGNNGSGKSTLLKIIYKLISYNQGEIELNCSYNDIIYLSDEFQLYEDLSVLENMELFFSFLNYTYDEKLYNDFNLDLIKKRKVKRLSNGEKYKVVLLCILCSRKELLLLDEPSAYLDIKTTKLLSEYIKNNNLTALIASNDSNLIDSFDMKINL